MLQVYGHYTYFTPSVRQSTSDVDPQTDKVKMDANNVNLFTDVNIIM